MSWIVVLIVFGVPVVLGLAMFSGGKIGYRLGYLAAEEERIRALRLSKGDPNKTVY